MSLGVLAAALSAACNTGGGDDGGDGGGTICETDAIAGEFADAGVVDFDDPGEPGLEVLEFDTNADPAPVGGIQSPSQDCSTLYSHLLYYGSFDQSVGAHHCFTTAVHAVHLYTRSILMMHGENDQRVWDIGTDPSSATWHPVPIRTEWEVVNTSENVWEPRCGLPDMFCTGHVQLGDGRLFVAGGNVTSQPAGGGLNDTYLFDPALAADLAAPGLDPFSTFGWLFEEAELADRRNSQSPQATYDRWYPTLTALRDGRVLISGGESRRAWDPENPGHPDVPTGRATRVLEVFDPLSNTIVELPGGEGALFPGETGVPQYPFMFTLPNGDVFYAGSEEADVAGSLEHYGQVLVPDYDREPNDAWAWLDLGDGIQSDIRGGSAVMYAPGKILKMGGRAFGGTEQSATAEVETIDLTLYASNAPGDPGDLPASFCRNVVSPEEPVEDCTPPPPMHEPRHFHTATMLPDGTVLVTGGNRFGNSSRLGESYHNPCSYDGEQHVGQDPEDFCVDPTCNADDQILYEEIDCLAGCPSVCVNDRLEVPGEYQADCTPDQPDDFECSVIESVACRTAAQCAGAPADDPEVPGDPCTAREGCERDGEACVVAPGFGDPCADVLDGATCEPGASTTALGACFRACEGLGDPCGLIMPVGGVCPVTSPRDGLGGRCSPENNACYATRTAEIWDPECNTWTELDAQEHPRMYHSTALLLPDARVISMGGGHRGFPSSTRLQEQTEAEYFAPGYADGAAAPAFDDSIAPDELLLPIRYPEDDLASEGVTVSVSSAVAVGHAALIKLGSVTHGFDMGQSFMKLDATAANTDGTMVTLVPSSDPEFPFNADTAPPGHYMVFLMSPSGEPSEARYMQIGGTAAAGFVCEASTTLVAEEVSCILEPVSGVCPSAGQSVDEIDLPLVDTVGGAIAGFRVVAPAGTLQDPESPTADEFAELEALCVTACAQHFEAQPGQSANCDAAGAFEEPILDAFPEHVPLDLIHSTRRHGEDLFSGEELTCDLGMDCYTAFDEVLRPVASDRVTPASAPLGIAEDWRVSVSGAMEALASTGGSSVSSSITGTIGYSLCAGGNASAACPFYLGSLEFELDEELVLPMQCGGQTETHTLSSLSVRLEQPAFGISQEGTAWHAFPPGSIVLDAEGVIDGLPVHVRRPNGEPLYLRAGEGWTLLQGADGAWLEFTVPCGEETADVLVWWGYTGVSVPDRRPSATITTPTSVPCPSTVDLTCSASDDDDDLDSARWFVDGVLLPHGVTSLPFTTGHHLRLVVRDERGATHTAERTVVCQ